MRFSRSVGRTHWAVSVASGATWLTMAACAAPPPPTYWDPFAALPRPTNVVDGGHDVAPVSSPPVATPPSNPDASIKHDDGAVAETLPNGQRWKFASFFNRVKKQLAGQWHPEDIIQRADPTGKLYGHKNRLTVLNVRLRPDGTLIEATVERGSGVAPLDEAATSAMRKAQPFPNPPRQLVDMDTREIHFRFGLAYEAEPKARTEAPTQLVTRSPRDAGVEAVDGGHD